jgi:hypothetical protein
MKKITALVISATVVLFSTVAQNKEPIESGQRRNVHQPGPKSAASRMVDVIILKGSEVPGLLGVPVEQIGGYAVRGGRIEVIPFQIDERDRNGDLIYTKYGGGTTAKRDGKLDGKDDIIFLSSDTGERRKGVPLPPGALGGAELKVTDPLGGSDAWCYLLRFEGKASRSDVDYVNYDPEKDWITGRYYTLGFPYRKAIQVPSYFSLSEAAGGDNQNIYDLYKLRLSLDFKIFGENTWSQDDFVSVPVGYVDGPVRVSRRIKSALHLAGPFRSAMIYNDSFYYPYYCAFPSLLQIPFRLGAIASRVTMRITDDLNEHAKGMVWYNERNTGGITITGKPSVEAEKLDKGSFGWKLAHGPQGTIITLTIFDPKLDIMKKELYYLDDEKEPDEPCQFRGQIANSGYNLTNIESVTKGNYTVSTYVLCPVDYERGDEQIYVDSITHPLKVSATEISAGHLAKVKN